MDNNNNNIPQIYDSTKDYSIYRDDTNDVFSARYNRFDNRYDYDRFYDRRFDRDYDRDYDRMRYYRYPYCDRYGRCDNSLWWMFWPFFFL